MNDNTINIRQIQHYMYCPRRFALIELNEDWQENAFVIKADILHQNVHDGKHSFSDNKKIVRSDISIYNDLPEYDLFGKADCIEFVKSSNGIKISGHDGRYKVRLIEYKPKAPKGENFHETDAIQLFAQKLCADHIWRCDSEAYLYYADIRKRVRPPFDTEYKKYDDMIKKLLVDMRTVLEKKIIPARRRGQKCSGCSLADICMPKENKYSVRDMTMSED